MGKKRSRKTKVSKGIHSNVATATLKAVHRDVSPLEKMLHKVAAWRAGKNPWMTVPGPSKKESWIKVRANSLYGDPRYATANMYKNKGEE